VAERRQPRQAKEDLRKLLLETGRSMLRDQGLGNGAEALTFKRVFERVGKEHGIRVTNASVIRRVWENQADFQADVLATIALDDHHLLVELGVGAVKPILDNVDLGSPTSRQETMRELCRITGELNARAVRLPSDWPLWIGVWALAASDQPLDHRQRIESALSTGLDRFIDQVVHAYAAMADFLGFRIRAPFSLHQFAVAADSLGQGYGLHERVDDSITEEIELPTGSGGQLQKWTLFAVAFESLVQRFFEIDPDWVPINGAQAT
jgi:hypothetical protein